jgi:hypothetical protein
MRKTLLSLLLSMAVLALSAHPDATVEEWKSLVRVDSPTSYTWDHHRVVHVRNERMSKLLDFAMQIDGNRELTQFSMTLTDGAGRQLRKVKMGDLERTEYSSELASDCYYIYYNVESPAYPVTMTLDFRVRCAANMLSYPLFMPQTAFNVDVKEACYELMLSADATCQYAAVNCDCTPQQTTDKKGRKVLTFRMDNLPAVSHEDLMPSLDECLPHVYLAPRQFTYYHTQGSLESWQTLGLWNYGLLTGRDVLPQAAKDRVHQLVDHLTSPREKTAAIYQFLKENTRYVSIQLGIGGYQPASAAEVWKSGFGDCKALTNYMAAMLREAGVPCVYTLVSTTDKRLLKHMPNFQQLDHVVLMVPEAHDTLWVECTNPQLPLGYVHDGIAGHDAVCLTSDGGQLVTLPEYADSLNLRQTHTEIALQADGTADISIDDACHYHRFPRVWAIGKMDKRRQDEAIGSRYHLPQSQLQSVAISHQHQPCQPPVSTIRLTAHSSRYASMTGSRLFVSLNPLRQSYGGQASGTRQHGISIDSGYKNTEWTVVRLPQGYTVEALPADAHEVTPFGCFSQHVTQRDGEVVVERALLFRHGEWPATQATEMASFLQHIEKQYTSRLVLKKQ